MLILIILKVSNDGKADKLIILEGTIPVLYHGSTYHIPIAIALPTSFPEKAPIVYVRPTSSMQIKSSKFVQPSGLVELPYTNDWKHVSFIKNFTNYLLCNTLNFVPYIF